MKCIAIGSADVGMTLAQPVYNHQGDLLFEAGSVLTDKDVRVLKSWGIEKIWVQKETEGTPSPGKKDTFEKGIEEVFGTILEDMFSDVLDDPVMAEIMRAAKKI